MQAKYQDTVSHLKLVLDMFQRGAYPQTLSIDNVVHLANTRFEGEVSQPIKEWSYDEVVSALHQLEKGGYHVHVDTASEEIMFTRYPL